MNDLLKKLFRKNITINLVDGHLDIKAPKGAMTSELLAEIKEHKQALISFMSEYQSEKEIDATISKASVKSHYTLSSSQYRLWLLQEIEKHTSAYNMPSLFSLKGVLNIQALEEAFSKLIERHEILRTNIILEKETGTPKQYIKPFNTNNFQLKVIDISNEKEISQIVQSVVEKEVNYNFDLATDALCRISLLKKSNTDYILVSVMHHIISDGWSSAVMTKDLFMLYRSIVKAAVIQLDSLPIQYKDFAEWQQSTINSESINEAKDFWLHQFNTDVPVLEIPTSTLRPSIKTYNGKTITKSFNTNVIKSFKETCKSQGATLFMGLLSAVKILLHKYTNQTDIVIGSPFAGREHSELQNQIGFYVNTVGLRSSFQKEHTFKMLLNQVKKTTLEAYKYQHYPFDELIKNLDVKTDRSRNPLFDVILTVDTKDTSLDKLKILPNLAVKEITLTDTTSKFDLEFSFKEDNEHTNLDLTYNTDIYSEVFVTQITKHLEVILQSINKDSESTIESIAYITNEEKKLLLETFNNTTIDYECTDKTYIDLFKEQVKKSPDNNAVVYNGRNITYLQLDELSSQLAHFLLTNYEIAAEDFIGAKLERSDWLVISFLAILKTGGAYLPIDTNYPQERINFIESDSNCKVIINSKTISKFQKEKAKIKAAPSIEVNANNLAYVIYTSGSTGKPKGTLIQHNNLINLCFWHINTYNVTSAGNATLYSGIAFDASIWEMCPYLLTGATLYPISNQTIRLDLPKLTAFLKDHNITHSYLPTAICHELVNSDFTSENITVLTGGDTLKVKKSPRFTLYNNYGPTENTVVTTSFNLKNDYQNAVPIGKPIANNFTYILDANLNPVPIGIPGKLYVSGAGVARGYLNNPELTKALFTANPFVQGERMYDTGDLAKWLPDGNIEFLGRKDSQVKIRGYRIELLEIEKTIIQFSEAIQQVVLHVKKVGKEKELVVYYTAKSTIEKPELKAFLKERLPSYMVPNYYMRLEEIPLTANGKIDKKSLPEIASNALIQPEYVSPRNEIEKQLVEIWQTILGVEKIGITDDLFELGGHSLKAMQIISKTNKLYSTTLTLHDIFENRNIAALSEIIKIQQQPKPLQKETTKVTSKHVSFAQKRIWLIQQLHANTDYHIPIILKLKENINGKRLQQSFRKVLENNEILRTVYEEGKSGLETKLLNANDWNLKSIKSQITLTDKIFSQIISMPFDLTKEFPLRAFLQKKNDSEATLIIILHHIAVDGWSVQLILNSLLKNYLNPKISHQQNAAGISYKDFIAYEQEIFNKKKTHEAYWKEKLQGFKTTILEGQKTSNRTKETSKTASVPFFFEATIKQQLEALCREEEVTLYIALLTIFKIILANASNQKDVCIGTPISLRDQQEYESVVGCFLNVLPMRTQCNTNASFKTYLNDVKNTVLEAFMHKDLPFEEIVRIVNPERVVGKHPIFQILFNMVQLEKSTKESIALDAQLYEGNWDNNKYDITLYVNNQEELQLELVYNTSLFEKTYIESMKENYITIVRKILANSSLKINEIITKTVNSDTQEDLWREMLN